MPNRKKGEKKYKSPGGDDVIYTIYIICAGLLAHNVPVDERDKEFTRGISKSLRKSLVEIQFPCLGTEDFVGPNSGKAVMSRLMCFGRWGVCPFHIHHGVVPDNVKNWRLASKVTEEVRKFLMVLCLYEDIAALHAIFPEVYPSGSSIDASNPPPEQEQDSTRASISPIMLEDLRSACLWGACRGGHKSLVLRLIRLGADVNDPNVVANFGYAASNFGYAALEGQIEIVQLLLASHADPNRPDKNGDRPLALATMGGHIDIVKLLLKEDPSLDMVNGALMKAVQSGDLEIGKLLMDAREKLVKKEEQVVGEKPSQSQPAPAVAVVPRVFKRAASLTLDDGVETAACIIGKQKKR